MTGCRGTTWRFVADIVDQLKPITLPKALHPCNPGSSRRIDRRPTTRWRFATSRPIPAHHDTLCAFRKRFLKEIEAAEIEARAAQRFAREQADYEAKGKAREERRAHR
jgi:hypothetical protein